MSEIATRLVSISRVKKSGLQDVDKLPSLATGRAGDWMGNAAGAGGGGEKTRLGGETHQGSSIN